MAPAAGELLIVLGGLLKLKAPVIAGDETGIGVGVGAGAGVGLGDGVTLPVCTAPLKPGFESPIGIGVGPNPRSTGSGAADCNPGVCLGVGVGTGVGSGFLNGVGPLTAGGLG